MTANAPEVSQRLHTLVQQYAVNQRAIITIQQQATAAKRKHLQQIRDCEKEILEIMGRNNCTIVNVPDSNPPAFVVVDQSTTAKTPSMESLQVGFSAAIRRISGTTTQEQLVTLWEQCMAPVWGEQKTVSSLRYVPVEPRVRSGAGVVATTAAPGQQG
jgi:hypothetical protein